MMNWKVGVFPNSVKKIIFFSAFRCIDQAQANHLSCQTNDRFYVVACETSIAGFTLVRDARRPLGTETADS